MLESYSSIVHSSGGASIVYGAEFGLWPSELVAADSIARYGELELRRSNVLRGLGAARSAGYAARYNSLDDTTPVNARGVYRHLNAGWVIGPVDVLHRLYAASTDVEDDQLHFTRYMFEHPEEVTLDYGGRLVLNLHRLIVSEVLHVQQGVARNIVTGATQCFVHGNGLGKSAWRDLLVQLNSHYS